MCLEEGHHSIPRGYCLNCPLKFYSPFSSLLQSQVRKVILVNMVWGETGAAGQGASAKNIAQWLKKTQKEQQPACLCMLLYDIEGQRSCHHDKIKTKAKDEREEKWKPLALVPLRWPNLEAFYQQASYDVLKLLLLFYYILVSQMVKNLPDPGFSPWVRKMPWRRECQPTPVFLPGEFHGQRNLVGYSWGPRVKHNWATNTSLQFKLLLVECFVTQRQKHPN